MFAVNEDFSALQKAQLDTLLKYTDAATQAAEQWFELTMKTSKAGVAEVLDQARALAAAKDVQELTSLQTSFSQANAEKVTGFARAAYGWASETHSQMTKLAEGQMAEANRSLASVIDKAAKAAPTGSEFAFAALKSALTAANQAYDVMSKAGKQVAAYTENTLSTAASTVETATRKRAA